MLFLPASSLAARTPATPNYLKLLIDDLQVSQSFQKPYVFVLHCTGVATLPILPPENSSFKTAQASPHQDTCQCLPVFPYADLPCPALSRRAFYGDEDVPYLCCPAWQPLATCGYGALLSSQYN